ncbi:hypothetical protein [Tistlia consotensis]|uniref:hypothetical protein n=1 Tax=Tistlia consotensis TaxID=1321365 RepID=UPI0011806119|nr:hypothetical protein [Tistlia consotensis]
MRRRRQRRWAVIRFLLIVGALGGSLALAYEFGKQIASGEMEALRTKLEKSQQEQEAFESQRSQLQAEVARAQQAETRWHERYQADVPQGAVADILNLVRQRLADGVPAERVQFVVEAVKKQRTCANKPETKRFIVRTPIYSGGADSVGFADSTITVTATGDSAVDEQGRPNAWFDPAKPLHFSVTPLGGKPKLVEGELPLQFSLVRRDTEYLFSAVVSDRRGFVEVTADSCNYP